jgi:hypothetical protein
MRKKAFFEFFTVLGGTMFYSINVICMPPFGFAFVKKETKSKSVFIDTIIQI